MTGYKIPVAKQPMVKLNSSVSLKAIREQSKWHGRITCIYKFIKLGSFTWAMTNKLKIDLFTEDTVR